MNDPSKPGESGVNQSVAKTWRRVALSSIALINRRYRPSKRFVSRQEYVARKRRKTALSSIGVLIFCMGVGSIPIIYSFADNTFIQIFVSGGSFFLVLLGAAAMKLGRTMDVGVPLTSDNIADLPAEDSLVRASQEPAQEQTPILLRAAISPQSTPPEEMVRVSMGSQKSQEI